MQDFSMLCLNNFLPHGGEANEPIPLRAVIADSFDTIIVVYSIARFLCIAYKNKLRKEPSNYTVEDFFPQSTLLLTQ